VLTFKKFIEEASNCFISKERLYSIIIGIIKNKSTYNQKTPPQNGETYGIDGTPESWARFYSELAGHESGYNACLPFKDHIGGVAEPGGSGGLFQLGRDQIEIWAKTYPGLAKEYGITPGRNYSEQELYDADLNTRGMLFIGDALLRKNYAVGPKVGLGRTIGSMSWNKIAKGKPTSSPASSSTAVAKNDQTSQSSPETAQDTSNTSYQSGSQGGGITSAISALKRGITDFSSALS
jgi:hypothetical protein